MNNSCVTSFNVKLTIPSNVFLAPKGSRTYCPSRLEPTETCYNLRVRQSRSVSIGHEKFAQLEGPNSCFDKKTTSYSTRKACRKMFSRTRVAALTIAHEEVGDGQEELLLLAYSL